MLRVLKVLKSTASITQGSESRQVKIYLTVNVKAGNSLYTGRLWYRMHSCQPTVGFIILSLSRIFFRYTKSLFYQDSAKNLTPLGYSSKTRRFGNYSCMNLWKSRPSFRLKSESNTCILDDMANTSWVKSNWGIRVFDHIFDLIFDSVFDSIFNSRSSNLTSIHQFYYLASTRLRSPTFSIRLDDKSRVGTPLRQYLYSTVCWQPHIWYHNLPGIKNSLVMDLKCGFNWAFGLLLYCTDTRQVHSF